MNHSPTPPFSLKIRWLFQKDAPPGRLYDLLKIDDTQQLQKNPSVSKNPNSLIVSIDLGTSNYVCSFPPSPISS
jgi:hypothetical protein